MFDSFSTSIQFLLSEYGIVATVLTFALVLLALVLVHEFGHFFAAQTMGIRVEEFGFGLPPRAVGKKWGETIYSLNWLPIGGFVRLYGEDVEDPSKITKEKNRAFFAKKPWQRAIVLVAGVVMNIVLAWVIITFLLTQGVPVPGESVYIQKVVVDSPADQAGIVEQDTIVSITGSDDVVYEITSPQEMVETTDMFGGQEILLLVERGTETLTIAITPRDNPPEGEGSMGVVISNFEEVKYPWYEAPWVGMKQTAEMFLAIVVGFFTLIWRLLTFQGAGVEVAGPVGIFTIVGQAREFGVNAVLEVTAILSLNLALLNILPFPALDGGRLLFVIIEAISGKKVKPQIEARVHQAGMFFLLGLLLLITVKDVLRLTGS